MWLAYPENSTNSDLAGFLAEFGKVYHIIFTKNKTFDILGGGVNIFIDNIYHSIGFAYLEFGLILTF